MHRHTDTQEVQMFAIVYCTIVSLTCVVDDYSLTKRIHSDEGVILSSVLNPHIKKYASIIYDKSSCFQLQAYAQRLGYDPVLIGPNPLFKGYSMFTNAFKPGGYSEETIELSTKRSATAPWRKKYMDVFGLPPESFCLDKMNIVSHTQCTVLVPHFSEKRETPFLKKTVKALELNDRIKKIVIGVPGKHRPVWYNKAVLVRMRSRSFAARFSLAEHSDTSCTIVMDDDIAIEEPYLTHFIDQYFQNNGTLTSPFLRPWIPDKNEYNFRDNHASKTKGARYSFALTKLFAVPTKQLRYFLCTSPRDVFEIIEHYNQCEDIAFNLSWWKLKGVCPAYSNVKVLDFGTGHAKKKFRGVSRRSSDKNHLTARTICLRELSDVFNIDPADAQCIGSYRIYSKENTIVK